MRRLTIIRHGLTAWNAAGRFQGHADVPLAPEGRAQSAALAGYAATFPSADAVISSPSVRAVETARIVYPGREPLTDGRLRELDFGAFEGRTRDELEHDPRWADWFADPYLRPAPAGEAYVQVRERVVAFLADARARWPDAHVVAFSHSGTIQMLIAHLLGVERPRWRKRIFVRPTGVTHVLFRGDDAVIERVNDTRHLVADGDDPFAA
jgi:broad specificity phosphatase PhoE